MLQEQSNDGLLDLFIFETSQNLEQLEQIIINNEQLNEYTTGAVNEIFRIMHTIKGSAAMMMFANISALAHHVEDMFSFIREQNGIQCDYSAVSDLVLECVDFIKEELEKIKTGEPADGDETVLLNRITAQLAELKEKNKLTASSDESMVEEEIPEADIDANIDTKKEGSNAYKAQILFEDGCQMESLRAYNVVHSIQEFASEVKYYPEDIAENDNSASLIKEQGFTVFFKTDRNYKQIHDFLEKTLFLRELKLEITGKKATELENIQNPRQEEETKEEKIADTPNGNHDTKIHDAQENKAVAEAAHQKGKASSALTESHFATSPIISVNVNKLDKLMDLISEMVITQEMVIHNPELNGLSLENFQKAAQQLKKITGELRDVIMSIRMVPLAMTFQKTNRIVRDVSKKLGKEINLKMIGEEIEVDKNIIEHISDPLMHLIRNSLDHGIESSEERVKSGKPPKGTVTLEARNEGSEVLIIVGDDGKGMNREKILASAKRKGIHTKPSSEMNDREVYSLIFLPGFSTKNEISEFSGRGVGMDVVVNNIESIGGRINIESIPGKGTDMIMKFPMTLAIIEGMNIRVGTSIYTLAITDIKESFKPSNNDIITDPDGNEMVMVRGSCYPIIRLHQIFDVEPDSKVLEDGILIMVETSEQRAMCLYADELIGQQEVVVKALPNYLKKIKGLTGCTLLGNGDISLILDVAGLMRTETA